MHGWVVLNCDFWNWNNSELLGIERKETSLKLN